MNSMLRPIAIALLASAALLGGCETQEIVYTPQPGGNTPNVPDVEGVFLPDPALAGKWLLEEGKLFHGFDVALTATAIEVDANGHALVYFRDAYTDAIDCVRAFLLFNGTTVALDLSREPGAQSLNQEHARFFPVVVMDDLSLGMADENGDVALFSRQAVLPSSVTCHTMQFPFSYEVPDPSYWTDLNHVNGDMIFNSDSGNIEVFDINTQSMGTPLGTNSNRWLQSVHSSGSTPQFWHHCGCGGSPEVRRGDLTTNFDTVHTANDLNRQIVVRAGEYLPSTNRLWLHGYTTSSSRGNFLIVNPNVEPDVLDQYIDFNRPVRALGFDGTDLWALVTIASQKLCRLDATTGRVLESFETPDPNMDWTGLAFDADGNLWLLGTDPTTQTGILTHTMVVSSAP